MYEQIEEMFKIKIIRETMDEIEINISKVKEKILFFYSINKLEDLESYTEKLAYLFQKNGYKKVIDKIIEGEKLGNRFIKKDDYTLPEFLWDLCIIFINEGNVEIPINIKSKVERNNFFARKIIIDQNQGDILEILKDKLFPEDKINNLIQNIDFSEDNIIDNLFIDENGNVKNEQKEDYIKYINENEFGEKNYSLSSIERYLKSLEMDINQIKSDFQKCKGE